MKNTNSTRTYYIVREAAWILGVDQSKVWRAIRTGVLPTTRRRSQLVVPAHALTRLLADQSDGGEAR